MNPVALVDDHVLLRQGLATLVNSFPGYQVVFEADNGKQLIEKINAAELPVAILLDINMPVMDGFETALWLKKNHPGIKILALSMSDEEEIIIKMLQSGAHGYVLKNTTPDELKTALDAVISKGYYLNELVGMNVMHSMSKAPEHVFDVKAFTAKEMQFIKLSCTELTYNEIADKMSLSPKTMEFYKDNIERKTGIRNRISLVRFALKNGIVKL
jgi:two-component system, NarL family, invasion response regulator UvrY